ncbi:hypothetical protein QUF84_00165 [Fictibacillus enclensis]|uniref:hypothetical protein n=1 Tax=Fictibacillus enclensis TaxID=1017270 RepID=UPI0025A2B84C|nr:hypothetical protein [Fictibacillus enclensis]MDM5335710.1 hypothetical protein [Fictibacillus enclensis]
MSKKLRVRISLVLTAICLFIPAPNYEHYPGASFFGWPLEAIAHHTWGDDRWTMAGGLNIFGNFAFFYFLLWVIMKIILFVHRKLT